MAREQKTYVDHTKCPEGHKFWLIRRLGTAGKKVRTYCRRCERAYQIVAGQPKENSNADHN